MARRSSTPGRAKRTMRRALPDRRRGRPRCTCPTCMRRNRTSRPESRASALYPSRPTCNGRRHCPSRSRREQKRRARTRNEADKEGLGAQSCGRSQTLLYNQRRPHSALSYLTPVAYAANLSATRDRLRNPDQLRRSHVAPSAPHGLKLIRSPKIGPFRVRVFRGIFPWLGGLWCELLGHSIVVGKSVERQS